MLSPYLRAGYGHDYGHVLSLVEAEAVGGCGVHFFGIDLLDAHTVFSDRGRLCRGSFAFCDGRDALSGQVICAL